MCGRTVKLELPRGVKVEVLVYCGPRTSDKKLKEMAIEQLRYSLADYDFSKINPRGGRNWNE